MPADIFQIIVDGEDDDFGHLHVVIIEIDSQQRLFIPAYDAKKEKVTRRCDALHKRGIYQDVGWLEMDNAKYITFDDPKKWTGKLARWMTFTIRRLEKANVPRKRVGEMSDEGLAKIVACLLKLHAERPGSTLADDELPKVKKLAAHLGVKVPAGL